MELREFAERVLFASSIEEKLAPPGMLTDERPGSPMESPIEPGRPADLRFKTLRGSDAVPGTPDAAFPGLRNLDQGEQRGRILHFFANHELLAVEIMALALLRFPEAPPAFRQGVLHTLRDEQEHTRWYMRRMQDCGIQFGELPVSGHLWRLLAPMPSPLDYVSGLPLTFEQANLDFSHIYGRAFAEAGDTETAELLARIHHDEIAHVALGLKWFRRWKDPALDDWEAYRVQLQFPLSPSRAKGPELHPEGRRAAGLDDVFIRQLGVFGRSRGRAPAVFLFNPFAEHALAGMDPSRLSRVHRQLARDLDILPAHLSRQDDVVLVHENPTTEFLESLQQAGLPVPEFDRLENGRISSASPLHRRAIATLRPWAWAPDSIECLAPLAGRLRSDSCRAALRLDAGRAALYGKAWSANFLRSWLERIPPEPWLCPLAHVGTPVHGLDDARSVIASIRARGHHRLVVKADLGMAGSNQIRLWEPEPTASQWRWIESNVGEGRPLVVEPWLDRLADFSLQLEQSGADLQTVGYTGLVNDLRGQFVANFAEPRHASQPPTSVARHFPHVRGFSRVFRGLLDSLLPALASAFHAAGHQGPIGIDAFAYRDTDGSVRIKPIVEVNPRHTFGRLTLELMRHVAPGSSGTLRLVGIRSCPVPSEAGVRPFLSLVQQLKRTHPVIRSGNPTPRLVSGVIPLNDPERAEAFLALFQVQPGSPDPTGSLPGIA